MTEKQYFNRLHGLCAKLKRADNARPYYPDAYNSIIDELNALNDNESKRRRRRPWMMLTILFVLSVILGMIVVLILDAIMI